MNSRTTPPTHSSPERTARRLDRLRGNGLRRVSLAPMTPMEQLRAGRLAHRVGQLLIGLVLFGVSMAGMVQAGFGLEPWGVLEWGLTRHLPLSYGEVTMVVSFVVLLLWIPLRQWPGLGTVLNAMVIGLSVDATLALTHAPTSLPARLALLAASVIGNGIAGALYIGSQLGPGPRDGLMTGLVRRTGRSVRLVRTVLEVAVVAVGWLLGGTVGLGTVVYALCIGPVVQAFLPLLTVRLDPAPSDAKAHNSLPKRPD